ncbi:MAG: Fic family protein [Patescibacteria group bacterium]|nr:Fic family protein [Patescibacteria group bacterium]
MLKISKRQALILQFIRKNNNTPNQAIKEYLEKINGETLSRITVVRDIDKLLKLKLVERIGKGRNVTYKEYLSNDLLGFFDAEQYFSKGPDARELKFSRFNFNLFSKLAGIFSKTELSESELLNKKYQNRIKKMPEAILKKEIERLMIEFSWKSSQIEGNTYSLIDTEILIKEKREASGHKREEAIMILNHKTALDYIFSEKKQIKKLSIRFIENVHGLLIKNLNINKGLRKNIVGITGTSYRPLDNQHQIREALEKMVKAINKLKNPLEKSLVANLMIAYIQPFEDGNKRTSRLVGNALLLADDYCPLSFRSINESDYKKAMILFYEQNSARLFKELFIEQFKFSLDNYFK